MGVMVAYGGQVFNLAISVLDMHNILHGETVKNRI